MSARKPDPALRAWDRLQAADRAHGAAYNARDEAEAKASASGSYTYVDRMVLVNNYHCFTVGEIRRRAKGLSPQVVQSLIDDLRQKERAYNDQRRQAGLARYDAAEARALREWRAAMQGMATARATTTLGIICKLKVVETDLRDGESGYGPAIVASAIKDLGRLSRRR